MLLPRSWVTLTSALTSAPEGSRVPMGARRAVPAAKASGRYRFGFTQREPKYQFAADSALEGDGFEPAVLSPCWGSSTIASPARPAIGRSYRAGWANNSVGGSGAIARRRGSALCLPERPATAHLAATAARPSARAAPPHAAGRTTTYRRGGSGHAAGLSRASAADLPPTAQPAPRPRPAAAARHASPISLTCCDVPVIAPPGCHAPGQHGRGQR